MFIDIENGIVENSSGLKLSCDVSCDKGDELICFDAFIDISIPNEGLIIEDKKG